MSFSAGCRRGQAGSLCSPEADPPITSTDHPEIRVLAVELDELSVLAQTSA
jgi:hypothetical protein